MAVWTHVGNCPKFGITPKPEKLKHFSSMAGIKLLDKTAFISLEAEVEMMLEEYNEDNLVMAFLGSTVSAGELLIGAGTTIERQVKLDGTNTFGARVEIILPHVFFSADKVVEFIGDKWGEMNIVGDVLLTTINATPAFGTIAFLTSPSTAPLTAPNTVNYFLGKGNVYTSPL